MSDRPVALITGGAKRVGRAIALRLAQGGFDVAITYRESHAEAEQLLEQLRGIGRHALAIRVDLRHADEAALQIADAIQHNFGRLNVLVNNASIYQPSSLQSATPAQMRAFWAIHIETPLLLCRQFEKQLRSARGHVINMIDLLGERPWTEYLAYCASKAGLWNLTLGLARELAPEVTVNGIAPGVIAWPDEFPEMEREKYLSRVPLARAGTPQDAAELVHFLATTGNYITGQIIRLDGGRSIV